jgi:hypothetical protein
MFRFRACQTRFKLPLLASRDVWLTAAKAVHLAQVVIRPKPSKKDAGR